MTLIIDILEALLTSSTCSLASLLKFDLVTNIDTEPTAGQMEDWNEPVKYRVAEMKFGWDNVVLKYLRKDVSRSVHFSVRALPLCI